VLCVGGLDPSGGAGILVDSAAVRSLGLHCAAVMALDTVQDGVDFMAASRMNADRVRAAVEMILSRQDVGAIKTGALGGREIVERLARIVRSRSSVPLVIDPVLFSSSGGALLDRPGVEAMRKDLLPAATLITPNLAEAAALTGLVVEDVGGMERAARSILGMGAAAVLVKGGHLEGAPADLLVSGEGEATLFRGERILGGDVRGTGCLLASLAAGRLALGDTLDQAVERAREGVRGAIALAYRAGDGPPMLRLP